MPDDDTYDSSGDLEDADLEDDGTLDASDTLEGDPGDDPLDQGIVPPDRWSAGEGFGTTLAEERAGESLDQLLAEEEPEPDPYAEADSGGEPDDAGLEQEPRSGRLVAQDEGTHSDAEPDLVARDVGIDAGAATAEEAAVHTTDEPGGATDD
ncbi:MAG TPA: DUF5709 domain-containing protein [Streptosporangiaceae bacterium]|nr:DUF5709 domain-containing protein [Streptosporangiaceae bacterium]